MKINELIYKCSKEVKDKVVYVTIRLDDENKNGNNSFRITGEVYQIGKPQKDKYMICCGCCHDEILEAFPEFKIFVDLHLCSSDGYPMYLENASYLIKKGEDEKAMRELRCDIDMYKKIYPYYIDSLLFKKAISDYGLLAIWNEQVKTAISYLERLTGDEFVENKHVPFFSEKEIEEIGSGMVTLEAILKKREIEKQEKRIKQIEEIEKKYSAKIAYAESEKKARLSMIDVDDDESF